MDMQAAKQLKKFVASVTKHQVFLVRFDVCDDRTCKQHGLPLPITLPVPEALGGGLEQFDPQRHVVVTEMVCVSKAHKKLLGIACGLLQMGVCLVRQKQSKQSRDSDSSEHGSVLDGGSLTE